MHAGAEGMARQFHLGAQNHRRDHGAKLGITRLRRADFGQGGETGEHRPGLGAGLGPGLAAGGEKRALQGGKLGEDVAAMAARFLVGDALIARLLQQQNRLEAADRDAFRRRRHFRGGITRHREAKFGGGLARRRLANSAGAEWTCNADHRRGSFFPDNSAARQILPAGPTGHAPAGGGFPRPPPWHGICENPSAIPSPAAVAIRPMSSGEKDGREFLTSRYFRGPTVLRPFACCLFALGVLFGPALAPAMAQIRIKDIADIEGVRQNQLVGYGLVVGLNGTGDRLMSAIFTRQSLIGMLERLGVNTMDQAQNLSTKNIAAVMVTAEFPAFARNGNRIDVTVSSLGDATDLMGGTLMVTPLLGADGEVYAVAQGAISTGSISARGAAQTVTRGVPTTGRIPNGATVEREVPFSLASLQILHLGLRNPDLTTAERMASVVNQALGGQLASVTDPRTIAVDLHGRDVVSTLARIENLHVEPDQPATVVVDEATGTIVMGADVRISTVAIAQGNLTIRITETPQVSQPGAFSGGQTVVVPRTDIQVDDQKNRKLGILHSGTTLQEVVSALNSLGIGPRDMITILEAIKSAGALQADLQVH